MLTEGKRKEQVTKLLKKVRDKIKNEPKVHKQWEWIRTQKEGGIGSVCTLNKLKKYDCKTPCCFAGHIAYEARFHFPALYKSSSLNQGDGIELVAKKIVKGYSDRLWSELTAGDFGGVDGKKGQVNVYVDILDLMAKKRSDRYIINHLLEFHLDSLSNEHIENLNYILTNDVPNNPKDTGDIHDDFCDEDEDDDGDSF